MANVSVKLKNEFLTVTISSYGAEITSIKDSNDKEYLHQKDMIFWNRQAPILFPICSNLIDGEIKIDSVTYSMPSHGFVMRNEFNLMECTEDLAVFSFVSNKETKEMYPYDFELIVTFKLMGKSLDVSYEVINDSDKDMYFSVGAHEGYECLEGIDNYEIHFEKEEKNNFYVYETDEVPEKFMKTENNHSVMMLHPDLFKDSVTISFDNPESDYVTLLNKESKKEIRVEFADFDNLYIWSVENSQFVCIEPWCGAPYKGKQIADISEKPGIHKLEKGGQFECHHAIAIL